jgi:hypothetical protein
MHDDTRVPVRSASIGFPDAPLHEPLVAAVLITLDPDKGQLRSYIRSVPGVATPDEEIVDLLRSSMELRSLPEVTR